MVIWSLIFLLLVAIAITIIVSYAFYVGKDGSGITDAGGNLTIPGVITASNLSPNNKEEILALQHKTQFIEIDGNTTTFNGDIQVKGITTTNESVVNVYDGYVQIVQNPADGTTPALSITQTGASSGPIMLVTDGDTNKIFEIGQNSEIYSSGGMTLEGDLVIGTGLRTVTFGVDAATGNTTISGNLQVNGDISGNNFGGNYFTDIGGVTANSPTTTLNIVGGNGIVVTPDDTAKSLTFSLDTNITDQIDTLSTDVGTLQTNVGTLQTNVGTLQTNVGTLQTNVGTLQTNVGTLSDKVIHITATPTSTEFSENISTGGNLLVTGDITSNANVNGNGANFTTLYSSESVYIGSNITATNFSTDINRTLNVGDLGLDVIVTEAPLPRTLPSFGGQLFSVSTLAGLQAALSSAVDGDTVSLTADITLSTTLAVNSGIRLTSDNGSRKITLNLLNATTIQWNAPSGLIQGITIESLGQGSNEVGLALTNVGGDIYVDSVNFNVDELGIVVNSLQVQITGCIFNYARLPANESMRYIQLLRTGNYSQNIIDTNTFNGVTSATSSIQCITTANAATGAFPNSTFVISNNVSIGNVQRLFMLVGTDMTGSQCQWFLKNNNLSCTSGFFIWYSASALQDQIAFYLDGNTEVLGGSATGSKGLIGFDNVGSIDSINFNCKIRARNNIIPVLRSDYSNLSLPDVGVVAFATGKIIPSQTFDSTYYDDVIVDGTLTVNGPATFNGTVETDGVTSSSITSNVITSNTLITGAIGIGSSPTSGSVIDAGSTSSSIILPKGTTAQQPTPVDGMMRYNTETGGFEGVSNSSWAPLAGGSGPTWTSETTNLGSPTTYLPVAAPYVSLNSVALMYQDSEDNYVTFCNAGAAPTPYIYNTISGAITTSVTISPLSANMARIVTSGTMVMVLSSTISSQFKLDEYSYNGTALTFVRNVVTISGTFRTYGLKMINTTGSNKILSFGTYNTSTNVGSVYLFNYDGTNWTQSLNSPLTISNTYYGANDTFIVWNTNLNVYQLALYDAKATGSNLYFWNLTNTGGAASITSTSTSQTISYPTSPYERSQASYDDADVNRPYFHISLGQYTVSTNINLGGFVSSYRWDGVQWSLATDWQVFNYVSPPANLANIYTGFTSIGNNDSSRGDITPIKTSGNILLISSQIGNIYQFITTKTDVAPYFSVTFVNTLRGYGGANNLVSLNISYGISPNGNYIFNKAPLTSLPFINVFRLGDGSPITEQYYQTPDIVRSTKIVGVENGGYVQIGVTTPSSVDTKTLKNGTLVFDGTDLYIYSDGWRRFTMSQ